MCRRLISLISKWPARHVKMWCKQTRCTLTDADIRFRLEMTETWQSRRSNWWICEWMKENHRQDTTWSQLGKRPVTRQHDWLLQTIYTKRMWMSTIQFCITTILQITEWASINTGQSDAFLMLLHNGSKPFFVCVHNFIKRRQGHWLK